MSVDDITKLFSSVIDLFKDIPSQVRDFDGLDIPSLLTSIISYGVQLYTGSSLAGYVASTVSFIMSICPKVSHALNLAKEFVVKNFQYLMAWIKGVTLQTESGTTIVQSVLSGLLSNPFCVSFRDMILSLVSARIFSKDVSAKISKVFGKPKSMSLLEVCSVVVDGISNMVKFASMLLEGHSFSEIWNASDPLSTFIQESEDLLRFKDHLNRGFRVEGYMLYSDFRLKAQELIDVSPTIISSKSPYDSKIKIAKSLTQDLIAATIEVDRTVNSQKRLPPYAFILCGPPGIGKSHLLSLIYEIYGEAVGKPFEDSQVYARNKNTTYWEGYIPFAQHIIYYTELGNESKSYVKTRGDPLLNEIQSLVDSNPYPVDMAFDNKGKFFAVPEVIAIDTNNRELHVGELMYSKSAIKRRFLYIDVSVLKEFRCSKGTGIDTQKSIDAGGNYLNRYSFRCTRYAPNGNDSVIEKVLFKGEDVVEFTRFLMGDIRTYVSKQKEMISKDLTNFVKEIGRNEKDQIKELSESDCCSDFNGQEFHDSIDLKQQEFGHENLENYEVEVFAESAILEEENQPHDENLPQPNSNLLSKSKKDILRSAIKQGWDDFKTYSKLLFSSIWLYFLCCCARGYRRDDPLLDRFIGSHIWIIVPFFVTYFVWNTIFKIIFTTVSMFGYFSIRHFGLKQLGHYNVIGVKLVRSQAKAHVSHLLFGTEYNPFIIPSWATIGFVFTIAVVVFKSYSLYSSYNKKQESESSQFFSDDAISSILQEKEDELGCGRSKARVRVNGQNATWNLADISYSKPVHNGSPLELYNSVSRNLRFVVVSSSKAQRPTHIFGVCQHFAIINKHATCGDKEFKIFHFPKGKHDKGAGFEEYIITKDDIVPFRDDLLLIRVVGMRFRNFLPHFLKSPHPQRFGGAVGSVESSMLYHKGTINVLDNFSEVTINGYISYEREYVDGMCGVPLVGAVTRSGCSIVGIHCAGNKECKTRIGVAIMQSDVEKAIAKLKNKKDMFEVLSASVLKSESLCLPGLKSPFKFEHLPHINYLGSTGKPVFMNNKSNIVKSGLYDSLDAIFDTIGFEPDEHFVVPTLKPRMVGEEYISPWNLSLKKINQTSPPLDMRIIDRIVKEYSERIISMIKAKHGNDYSLNPLDIQTAVNGHERDAYLRRINPSTSGGYGYGAKDPHIPIVHEEDSIREATPELKTRINEILETYENGDSANFIYGTSLKDEPRDAKKNAIGKIRVFYMTSLDNLIVSRMFLAPFYTMMVEDGEIFRTSVGTNMHSDADAIYEQMRAFSNDIIEGDYSNFDVTIPFGIGHAAASVVLRVLKAFGYNTMALNMTEGILSDALFSLVHMNGDIFFKPGLQPSGKYGTAEDNSLRGVLMQMYIYYTIPALWKTSFFRETMLFTYGDDYLNGLSKKAAEHLNNFVYRDKCLEHFNMKVTPASKAGVMTEFVTPDDMSFLRRTWVWDPVHKVHNAKLNMNSIYKSLQWTAPSQIESVADQELSTIRSALWELFFHLDRDTHHKFRNLLVEAYCLAHKVPINGVLQDLPTWTNIESKLFPEFQSESGEVRAKATDMLNALELEEVKEQYTAEELHLYKSLWSDPKVDVRAMKRNVSAQADAVATKVFLDRFLKKKSMPDFYTESGELSSGLVSDSKRILTQNFEDMVGEGEKTVEMSSRPLHNGQYTLLQANDFLSRPVELANFSIPLSSDLGVAFPIWDLFTLEEAVRAKLRNYAYLRGDLCVRITVSGSPFHSGRLLVSYQPCANRNANLTALNASPNYRTMLLNYLSQAPESGIIDVKANKPLMLRCPYISTKPAFRLWNESSSVIAATTSYADIEEAGRLYLYTMNQVKAVSDSPSTPYVQIVAWMENVQLGCPTATQIEISTESGNMEDDEFEAGPVEKFSSAAVQVSDALKVVPYIAPFATASSFIFNGMKTFSSIFGWSKPPIVGDPIFVKNRPFANGCQTIGASTVKRIGLDPKQEVSIDPSPCGVDQDDMIIANIAARESYFTTFTWAPTDSILSNSIFKCRVHPQLDTVYRGFGLKDYYQPTALSFASTPFTFWRGDLVFRFDFVCSAYHRGKLVVYYEPNISQHALMDLDIDLNKQWIQVIDIQETQSVEFCVKWAASRPWMRLMNAPKSILNYQSFTNSSAYQEVNGYIGVAVLTEIQSPDDSSIEVNVFVRGENMRFNALTEANMPSERMVLDPFDMGLMPPELFNVTTESGMVKDNSDQPVSCISLNDSTATDDWISKMYFGEEPVSFRSLLKRYVETRHASVDVGTSSDRCVIATSNIMPNIDPPYGSAISGEKTLLSYLRYAYLGTKGGMRKRVRLLGNSSFDSPYLRTSISLLEFGGSYLENFEWTSSHAQVKQMGTVSFVPHTNGGLEAEIPFYSPNLFSYSFADNLIGDNPTGDMSVSWYKRYICQFESMDGSVGGAEFIEETATAEDFMFMRFMGAPCFSNDKIL
ncbi:hypothetical protein [Wenzhou picorna-like virus 24]|uniref:hypothetical protein n=1 Tax=Wenzhou picorna-like virus 24 TaxID=1923609 RepID=UPI00090BFF40|nr:hypothetical protein [Wenzhou picorna-like virus 24]APG78560.1 hypothetical protein [Wenzhou picorna-like virus 24]